MGVGSSNTDLIGLICGAWWISVCGHVAVHLKSLTNDSDIYSGLRTTVQQVSDLSPSSVWSNGWIHGRLNKLTGNAISLWSEVKLLSCVWPFANPWTGAHQAPPSMEFSRQEYWSGLPFPFPGDLPDSGIEPRSPSLQADFFTSWASREARWH